MPNETIEGAREQSHGRSLNTPDGGRTDALRQMLLERRQGVLREIEDLLRRRRASQAQQQQEAVQDTADQARRDAAGDRDLSILESRHRLRQQYDDALLRVEEGAYGICEDCRTPIGEGRLKVVPFAKRCLPCQEKAEAIDQLEHAEERRSI